MTGGRVFDQSLAALAPLGRLAVFGMAGRTPPSPVDPGRLMARSTAVIGFWLMHVVQRPQLLAEAVTDLLALIADGSLRPVRRRHLQPRHRPPRPTARCSTAARSASSCSIPGPDSRPGRSGADQTSRPPQNMAVPPADQSTNRPMTRK